MNTYRKYCPNVFLAECEEEHAKDDVITLTTKYDKENEHIVHNLIAKKNDKYYYSITRLDGFNSQERAKNKAEKLEGYALSAEKRSNEWIDKSSEGRDFLSLGEPIKVGHHSERKHRALINRNNHRMSKAMEESEKAKEYKNKIAYWENKTTEINLSMPESIEYYAYKLEKAKNYHKGLKDGSIKREHSFSLTYAKKTVNDLQKKYNTAIKLWQ